MYDREIALRTALLGALTAFLASPHIGLSPELSAALGTLVGAALDYILWRIKCRSHSEVS